MDDDMVYIFSGRQVDAMFQSDISVVWNTGLVLNSTGDLANALVAMA